jgi:hypothetical protein
LECFWALWKVLSEVIPSEPLKGPTERSGRHSNPKSRQQMRQNGPNAVRIAYGNLVGKRKMGQESKGWNVRCAQKNDTEGRGWVGQ